MRRIGQAWHGSYVTTMPVRRWNVARLERGASKDSKSVLSQSFLSSPLARSPGCGSAPNLPMEGASTEVRPNKQTWQTKTYGQERGMQQTENAKSTG